jgi:DNA (cytosine-5)-methyltransferase 1
VLTRYRRADHGATMSHFMCGLGGDTLGFFLAGYDPVFNTNHSQRVIETIEANFPNTRTKVADVSNLDFRNLPRTVGLFGSPICQESSPAGGRKRPKKVSQAQGKLFDGEDQVDDATWERTRTTAYCILRAAEIVGYDFVACENVIEFATDWPMFLWWIKGMDILGYNATVTCVSSAHVGGDDNPHAPQWRDRVYVVFTRRGIRTPDLSVHPLARCVCGEDVEADQWWKDPAESSVGPYLIGKYRAQYLYRTPHEGKCGKAVVEPYVRPAASIIDFADLGQRIGDRKRPIVPNTRARIRRGLEMFRCAGPEMARGYMAPPMLVPSGGTYADRPMAAFGEPMRTLTANPKGSETLVCPPFIAELRNNCTARSLAEPISTIAAGGNHHALIIPDTMVVPYYSTGVPKSVLAPFDTFTVRDRFALVATAAEIDDCHLRMVHNKEKLKAQAVPDWYVVKGNVGEVGAQAGNAVSVNVGYMLAKRIYAVLDDRSAA